MRISERGSWQMSLLLAALLPAGCAASPGMPLGGMLALDRLDSPAAPTSIAGAARVPASDTYQAPTPVMLPGSTSGGGQSGALIASGRRLTIDLRGFLAGFRPATQRRVLATVSDISKLVLTVQQPGHPDQSATLTQAQLASGVAEFSFSNLPAGNAIVFVVAYDAAGIPLGSAAQVVVISDAASSVADLTVQLVPSSTTSGPGGTLVTRTTILNGPNSTPPLGTILAEFESSGWLHTLVPGPGSTMFVAGSILDTQFGTPIHLRFHNMVARLGQDGNQLFQLTSHDFMPSFLAFSPATNQLWSSSAGGRSINLDGTRSASFGLPPTNLAVDAAGNVFYAQSTVNGSRLYKMTPAGISTLTSMEGSGPLAFDKAGRLWTGWSPSTDAPSTLRCYAPDGTLLGSHAMPGPTKRVYVAPSGDVWVANSSVIPEDIASISPSATTTKLTKLAPDGTVLKTIDMPARQLAFDAQGRLWVTGERLTTLSSNGETLASFPMNTAAVAVDDSGYVWISAWTDDDQVVVRRLQP